MDYQLFFRVQRSASTCFSPELGCFKDARLDHLNVGLNSESSQFDRVAVGVQVVHSPFLQLASTLAAATVFPRWAGGGSSCYFFFVAKMNELGASES